MRDFLETLLGKQYTADDAEAIITGCTVDRCVTLRANTLKSTRDDVATALDQAALPWTSVPWYRDAFALTGTRERDLWELEIYRNGDVYLQSLSSMIPALALDAKPGEDICDMCAAPGGKTTQIMALTDGKAYVTACEMHMPRAEKLEHNLAKLGAGNVTVMRTDARRLDEFFSFDRILVDAPCSGSGTLKLDDPRMEKRFTQTLIDKSVKAQRALLSKALSLVRPGGTVVYSTCSVLACENDDIVEWALGHTPRKVAFELKPIELEGSDTLPLLPTRIEGALSICPTELYEGFFVAKIHRTR